MQPSRLIPPLALAGTLLLIRTVPWSPALVLLLPVFWSALFRPLSRNEYLLFVVAGVFITAQNYTVLRTGAFAFSQQDFLLMPFYEPLLWGFYFLTLKRFFAQHEQVERLEPQALLGLLGVSLAFGLFAGTGWLSPAVFVAGGILVALFHTREDIWHGLFALVMGFVVEVFGVSTGQWSYPAPDMLGIPFWFAPMWVSVGILGRRLLFPLVNVLEKLIFRD